MSLSPVMALRQVGVDHVNYWGALPISSAKSMENVASTNSKADGMLPSADEAPLKVRKAYTITKQREKWTEEEHQKFLDALKLHGRAWRRIEDHIGTKTAVQIRSHAQKFFSKLGREASLGGPTARAGSGEIEIPPPRPKRKPTHPYPKKASGTLLTSPSFEEDNKLAPSVYSAFTPLERTSGAAKASLPSKKTGSPTASLRLFGQTVIQGTDKAEADNDLMESTGSPRSQISVETEETSGISLVGSNAGDQSSSLPSNLSKPAKTEPLNGFSEWEKSLFAVYGPNMLGGYHLAQPIPAFWQGFVPQHFVHAAKDDGNTSAATYAIASACGAIWGALINNESNFSNACIVYNPTAVPAAAGKLMSLSVPLSPPDELLPKGGPACRCDDAKIESASPPVIHEESTAECSSSLTDSSRLASYESNDEMKPVKKRRRNFLGGAMPVCNTEFWGPLNFDTNSCRSEDPDNFQNRNADAAVHLSSTDGYANGSSHKSNAEQTLSDEVMQPADGNRQSSSSGSEQPVNLIIEACASSSLAETEEFSSKAKGFLTESGCSGKESAASLSACDEVHYKSCTSNECQGSVLNTQKKVVNNTNTESGKHLFAFKVGATSSRYSGVGFVPYRKNP